MLLYRISLPEDLAIELLDEPGFYDAIAMRSSAGQVAEIALTALNTTAAVVTLAQGKDVLGRVVAMLHRRGDDASSLQMKLETPDGLDVTFTARNQASLAEAAKLIERFVESEDNGPV